MPCVSSLTMRKFAGRGSVLAVLSVLSLVSLPASAQEPRAKVRQAPQTSGFNVFVTRRARLGITVNMQARESDSLGASVSAVSPGGPADKAGIQTGDIITRLDGTALVGSKRAQRPGDEERSLPGLRLIELASRLEPNDTIEVEYRRGNSAKKATLVTSDDPPQVWSFDGPEGARGFAYRYGPDVERMRIEMDSLPMKFPRGQLMFMGPFADLELAPLNTELGQYFGTTEGVLVISVPQGSTLNLKGGDVILAVDGRKPSNPGHLLRILQSYDGNESVKFDIMRSKKRESVTGKIPERETRWRVPRGDGSKPREGV